MNDTAPPRLNPVTPTFCGVPAVPDLAALDAEVAIFGAAHGTPYTPGVASHAANGAGAVRAALDWYSANPEQYDFDLGGNLFGGNRVVDCGNVPGDLADGAANRRGIRAATRAILQRGAVPLMLGGDDSTPIPFIEAFADRGPVTIVQVDAHIDWRHEVDGVIHGFSSTMRRASEMGHVSDIIQIGARGPGSARQAELDNARAWGARLFTARDVHRHGVDPALEEVRNGADVILSVDVDGLDPAVVPGVILPAQGGIGYQQMLDVILGIGKKARLVGVTFVEFVPERDRDGMSARTIARLASVAAGVVGR